MSEPMLNINFCGTRMQATREDPASIKAIRKFKNRLIISGVGAASVENKARDEKHLTPGTFFIDQQNKPQKRLFRAPESYYTGALGAGALFGSGEKDIIKLAMRQIKNKFSKKKLTEFPHINVSGYSRGVMSAVHLANKIYLKYGNRIKINLFLIDPVGGPNWIEQSRRNIPPNVDNLYITFNKNEVIPFIQSHSPSDFLLTNPKTNAAYIYFNGGHIEQEMVDEQHKDKIDAPANINEQLLTLFYSSYGAIKVNPNKRSCLPIKTETVQARFVGDKTTKTALDEVIENMNQVSADKPFFLKCGHPTDESSFNVLLQSIINEKYLKLSYYFTHFLAEITREKHQYPNRSESLNTLLQITNNLMTTMTQGEEHSLKEKIEALNVFQDCVNTTIHSDNLKEIASYIVGLVLGVVLLVPYIFIGLTAGLVEWSSLGLATIPSLIIGIEEGLEQGFRWGRQLVIGEKNSRLILSESQALLQGEHETQAPKPKQ